MSVFAFMYVCASWTCLVPSEESNGVRSPRTGGNPVLSHCVRAETELRSHAKAASVLNSQAYINTFYFMIIFLFFKTHCNIFSLSLYHQNTEKSLNGGVCVDGTVNKGLAMQARGPMFRAPA